MTQVNHGGYGIAHPGGNTVTVRGDDGMFYYYAHMTDTMAQVGQHVGAGAQIGTVGNSGNAYKKDQGLPEGATHLHFMISKTGSESTSIDPFPELKQTGPGTKVATAAETLSGGSTGGGARTDAGGVVYETFAADVLRKIGAPTNDENMAVMMAWMTKEGGGRGKSTYKFNPLNTGKKGYPGAVYHGSHGLASYASYEQGVDATAATLQLGYYQAMLKAFQSGHGAQAIGHMDEHWCPRAECPGYVAAVQQIYQGLSGKKFSGLGSGVVAGSAGADVIGDSTANTLFQMQPASDPDVSAEKLFRQMHPDEAMAGDLSDQYNSFVGLLAGTGGGIGGTPK